MIRNQVHEDPKTNEEEEISTSSKAKNPWQNEVHKQDKDETPNLQEEDEQMTPPLRSSSRPRRPNPKYANAALVEDLEPATYEEAAKNNKWRKAIEQEMEALKQNKTWELVPQPEGVKPISCKWVYMVKTRADGSIERYKARLVTRGFSQQYRLDYDETLSPVEKIMAVRVLLALTASKRWKLWQMDVKNAFLHGELDRDIYMDQPQGFQNKAHQEYVRKLKKALYGLK